MSVDRNIQSVKVSIPLTKEIKSALCKIQKDYSLFSADLNFNPDCSSKELSRGINGVKSPNLFTNTRNSTAKVFPVKNGKKQLDYKYSVSCKQKNTYNRSSVERTTSGSIKYNHVPSSVKKNLIVKIERCPFNRLFDGECKRSRLPDFFTRTNDFNGQYINSFTNSDNESDENTEITKFKNCIKMPRFIDSSSDDDGSDNSSVKEFSQKTVSNEANLNTNVQDNLPMSMENVVSTVKTEKSKFKRIKINNHHDNRKKPVNIQVTFHSVNSRKNYTLKEANRKMKKWDLKFTGTPLKISSMDSIFRGATLNNENSSEPKKETGNTKENIAISSPRKVIQNSDKETLDVFKMPIKRPPPNIRVMTRNEKCNELGVMTRNVLELPSPPTLQDHRNEKEDDLISLCPSFSICDMEQNIPDHHPVGVIDENSSSGHSSSSELNTISESAISESANRVQEWMNDVDVVPNEENSQQKRFKSAPVPHVFRSLCYIAFLSDKVCTKPHCTYLHNVPENMMLTRLREITTSQLKIAYSYMLNYKTLYQSLYILFAEVFAERMLQLDLLNMADDMFLIKSLDYVECMQTILQSIQKIGNSLQESVEMIVSYIGLRRRPCLSNILTEVISRSVERADLTNFWPVIKRLTNGGEKLQQHIAETVLRRILFGHIDKPKLCEEVFIYMTKNQLADVKIPSDIVQAYENIKKSNGIDIHVYNNQTERRLCIGSLDNLRSNNLSKVVETFSPTLPISNCSEKRKDQTQYSDRRSEDDDSVLNSDISLDKCPVNTYCSLYRGQTQNSSLYNTSYKNANGLPRQKTPDKSLTLDLDERQNHIFYQNSCNSDSYAVKSSASGSMPDGSPQLYCDRSEIEYDPTIDYSFLTNLSTKSLNTNSSACFSCEEIVKMPKCPMVGNLCLDKDYQLHLSLHNLCPRITDGVAIIDTTDLVNLKNSISQETADDFLPIFEKYKGPLTLQSFIIMVINYLMVHNRKISQVFLDLVDNIEKVNTNFYGNTFIRVLLEVVAMNLLFQLDKIGYWQGAMSILEKFKNWDSLITSKLLIAPKTSIIGRYIFLSKVFVFSNRFDLAFEILQCPSLNILGSSSNWRFDYVAITDLTSRNSILEKIFTEGFYSSIATVCQLYKLAFKHRSVQQYDVLSHFNPMLTKLIDKKLTISMRCILNDIKLFSDYMENNNLRGLICCMHRMFTAEGKTAQECFKLLSTLYEIGVKKGIYSRPHSCRVAVKLNYLNEELDLTIRHYFSLVLKRVLVPENVEFIVGTPFPHCSSPGIINVARSLKDVNDIMLSTFQCMGFKHVISIVPSVIMLKKEEILDLVLRGCLV